MTRYHTTAAGDIPFTEEEETQRDAEEVAAAEAAANAVIVDMQNYMAEVRTIREAILLRIGNIYTYSLRAGDNTMMDAIETARAALLAIPSNPYVLACTNVADLKATVIYLYRQIVNAAPTDLKTAFGEPDA